MSDSDSKSALVVNWFKNLVRPVFEKTETEPVLEELDKLASQVAELDRNREHLFPICLLGQAGVGKSTLINTLIADGDIVVPSGGGTGPLTANALRVIYGERPSFAVRYHSTKQLGQTRFILESEIQRQAKLKASSASPEANADVAVEYKGEDEAQEGSEFIAAELDGEEQKKTRTEEAVGRARLLIAGAQSADRELSYLADALRWILGQKLRFDTQILEEDMERLRHVQEALTHGTNETARRVDSEGYPNFRHYLRDHACGYLAPLIQEMSIHWPSELLRDSLELVDLPGIGILSDAYVSVTSDYLRNRAKAVMLVTNDRGIRLEDAELLKTSGFLNRMLHASSDLASDPVALMVVVVKIDDVAVENWNNDKAMNGVAQKTKAQHFFEQVDRCRKDIAQRLQTYLRDVWDEDSEGKRLVIQSLVDNLQVFPVSAPQYRLHCSDDPDDDKPFLPDKESTNIIALRNAISEVARHCLAEKERRREETLQRFFGQLRARLEVLNAQRSEAQQAIEAINEFKEQLDAFMAPLQREFDTRRGGFRTFLRKTIPKTIEAKVESASNKARKDITSDLRKLRDANWRTLQAAVRREGTFYGSRHINLPHDFALRFESPTAEVWSREILVDVRRETREFADYQSGAVNEVLDWSREQGFRPSTRLLEALIETVKQHRQQVNAVGKEAVDEIRDKVREELIKKIEPIIRRKCKKFVDDNKNYGTGVKSRILELFNELGDDVVTAASAPAITLLVDRFKEVDKEILAAFGNHSEPLTEAAEALIQRREKNAQRDDNQLSAAIEAATAAMPISQVGAL